MSFKNVAIPIKCITNCEIFLALLMMPLYEYDCGKPTENQIGYKMEVVEMTTYEKFTVKILNTLPTVTPEILASSTDKTFVRFIDAVAKPYINNGRIAYSFSAKNVEIAKKSVLPQTERR